MIIHCNCTIGSFLLHSFLLIYHPYPPSFHEMIFTLLHLFIRKARGKKYALTQIELKEVDERITGVILDIIIEYQSHHYMYLSSAVPPNESKHAKGLIQCNFVHLSC